MGWGGCRGGVGKCGCGVWGVGVVLGCGCVGVGKWGSGDNK
ncbi:hypothetical protein [Microcystis aeruginosa]|nr:hypothetical protein [Microcystis aeruginosa]